VCTGGRGSRSSASGSTRSGGTGGLARGARVHIVLSVLVRCVVLHIAALAVGSLLLRTCTAAAPATPTASAALASFATAPAAAPTAATAPALRLRHLASRDRGCVFLRLELCGSAGGEARLTRCDP
jgi:hypothetical protein